MMCSRSLATSASRVAIRASADSSARDSRWLVTWRSSDTLRREALGSEPEGTRHLSCLGPHPGPPQVVRGSPPARRQGLGPPGSLTMASLARSSRSITDLLDLLGRPGRTPDLGGRVLGRTAAQGQVVGVLALVALRTAFGPHPRSTSQGR